MSANNSVTSSIKVTKNPWTVHEDALLLSLIPRYGVDGNWSSLATNIPNRTGKQCRERYHNHLRPDITKESWSSAEDRIINEAQLKMGNQWTKISKLLPGRTDNSVKNRWHIIHRPKTSVSTVVVPKLPLHLLPSKDKQIEAYEAEYCCDLLARFYSHEAHRHVVSNSPIPDCGNSSRVKHNGNQSDAEGGPETETRSDDECCNSFANVPPSHQKLLRRTQLSTCNKENKQYMNLSNTCEYIQKEGQEQEQGQQQQHRGDEERVASSMSQWEYSRDCPSSLSQLVNVYPPSQQQQQQQQQQSMQSSSSLGSNTFCDSDEQEADTDGWIDNLFTMQPFPSMEVLCPVPSSTSSASIVTKVRLDGSFKGEYGDRESDGEVSTPTSTAFTSFCSLASNAASSTAFTTAATTTAVCSSSNPNSSVPVVKQERPARSIPANSSAGGSSYSSPLVVKVCEKRPHPTTPNLLFSMEV
jgi:hypothetical protein